MHEIVPQFVNVDVPGFAPLILLIAFFATVGVTLWSSE
jgi:hypothetical protein